MEKAMNRDMHGKTCVITGGARGIGRAFAERFAESGANVAVLDLAIPDGAAAAIEKRGGRCIGITCDVSDPAAVEAARVAVEGELGECDILINNAAMFPVLTFDELTFEKWKRAFDVNIHGVFLMCKAFTAGMRRRQWGRIINIASIQFWTKTLCGPHYSSSKGAVIGLTRALADEFGQYSITANAIAPGAIGTETALASQLGPNIQIAATRQSIKRMGQAEDLAGTAVFLASEDAGFITGQTIIVDGGIFRV
jgi:NAD(P)-dependent dehydrogenase (short-subunit alcohol dehydrogenase family)